MGSADADVVHCAVDSQGHGPGFVDAGVTDPVVGVGVPVDAVLNCCLAEGGLHDGGGDHPVCGHVKGVAGAVVEPGDDLDAFGVGLDVGQWIVGEIRLPGAG